MTFASPLGENEPHHRRALYHKNGAIDQKKLLLVCDDMSLQKDIFIV